VIIGGGKDGLPIILGNVDNAVGTNSKANATEDEAAPHEKMSAPSSGQINTPPKPAASAAGAPAAVETGKSNPPAVSSTPPNVTQANPPAAPTSILPLDLSQIKNYVPRLPEWLRSATSGAGAGTGVPKQ
jgi:hypothetical protein